VSRAANAFRKGVPNRGINCKDAYRSCVGINNLPINYTILPQDALDKEYSQKPSQEIAAGILNKGYQALKVHSNNFHDQITLGYIEGMAKVRFALSVVAEHFHECATMKPEECATTKPEQFHKHVTMKPALLHAVRTLCTDPSINHIDQTGQTDTTGPALYLLKLIVRQYGFSCLTKVAKKHPWVVPHELKQVDEVTMLIADCYC